MAYRNKYWINSGVLKRGLGNLDTENNFISLDKVVWEILKCCGIDCCNGGFLGLVEPFTLLIAPSDGQTKLNIMDSHGKAGDDVCTSYTTQTVSFSLNLTAWTTPVINSGISITMCGLNLTEITDITNNNVTLYCKRTLTDCGGTATSILALTVDLVAGIVTEVNGVAC